MTTASSPLPAPIANDIFAWTAHDRRRRLTNRLATGLCLAMCALTALSLGAILAFVVGNGLLGLDRQFFTMEATGYNQGGALAAIAGSLQIVPLATIIAAPLGILAGVYLSEQKDGRLASILRVATETMVGLPSVVIGIFVFTVLVLPFKQYSAAAGAAALAIIMVPIIARSTEEILLLVPGSVREAALALGIPVWRTTLSVVLRTALAGILTAVMLAVARAAGETAPLILTAIGNQALNVGNLTAPMDSLPTFIYFNSGQPDDLLVAQAWGASLVLLLFVLIVNIAVRGRSVGRRAV